MHVLSTPLKTSEGCFQGVEKGCIGNKWVNETVEWLVRNNPANNDVIISYIDYLKYNTNSFKLRASTYDEVVKSLKSLWNRCSIGYDNIPVLFIYPIAKHIASFLTSIINNLTNDWNFRTNGKSACISPKPKVLNPIVELKHQPISILPMLSKI